MSTDLHKRMLAFNYGDDERSALMRRVWQDTPWMVDAWTGPSCEGRDREMRDWCYRTFGDECQPIHGRPGLWRRGSATIHGWTWFGFATQGQLRAFELAFPTPAEALEAREVVVRGAGGGDA